MGTLLVFDISSLNWADILVGGFVGLILVYVVEYLKISRFRKTLRKNEGTYIATDKEEGKRKAIIKLTLKKGTNLTFQLEGESLLNTAFHGMIDINSNNLKIGKGTYAHNPVKSDFGEYIGFGSIDISIHSCDCILMVFTYQSGYGFITNPEVWRKVEGDDKGKSIVELRDKYSKDSESITEGITYIT